MKERVDAFFILPNLSGGGAERITLNVVNGIDLAGGVASLFMLKDALSSYSIPSNLVRHGRFISGSSRQFASGRFGWLSILVSEVLRCRVLVGALELKSHFIAAILGIIFRKPVILWLHKDLFVFLGKKPWLFRVIYKLIFSFNLKISRKLVVVSDGAAAGAIKLFPEAVHKIIRIYNPIDFRAIDDSRINENKTSWEDKKFILSVGRLIWLKGFDLLIESFQPLAKKFPDLQLVILGEGEMRDELERRVSKLGLAGRVEMPGFSVPYVAMTHAMAMVMASRFEGLPTVLIEALHCGAKIISTDCPSGPDEILDNGRYGTLVPVDSPVDLTHAIETKLLNGDIEGEKKERQLRAQDFSFGKIIPQWFDLFADVER